jgi:hypothetical protein
VPDGVEAMPTAPGRRAQETNGMSKTRAAGVLGALIFSGLLLLSTLAVAAGDPFHSRYFAKLQLAFVGACLKAAARGDVTIPDNASPSVELVARLAFLQACSFVVTALKPLTPAELADLDEAAREAALDAFRKTVLFRKNMTCDACVMAVADFEVLLATNSTPVDTLDALGMGCDKRFSNSTQADQCRDFIGPLPTLIDFILANLPPVTACQELDFCPLP